MKVRIHVSLKPGVLDPQGRAVHHALEGLGFRSDEGFNLFVWARNAFDEQYFEQLQVPSGNTGLIVGNPGDPRTYGLTVAAEF